MSLRIGYKYERAGGASTWRDFSTTTRTCRCRASRPVRPRSPMRRAPGFTASRASFRYNVSTSGPHRRPPGYMPATVVYQRALLWLLRSCGGLIHRADFCASGPGSIVQTATNASGYHMQRSPDYSGNVGASYRIPTPQTGEFTCRATFTTPPRSTSILSSSSNRVATRCCPQGSVTDPSKRFTVALFGDNVTTSATRPRCCSTRSASAACGVRRRRWCSVGARF